MKKFLMASVLSVGVSSCFASQVFMLSEQNASGLGLAYSGTAASAENASTVSYNPAGMSMLRGFNYSLGGVGLGTSARFSDSGSNGGSLGGNGGDAGGKHFVPNMYLTKQVNDQISVGFGVNSFFGLESKYDTPWVGSAQSEHMRLKTMNFNPSVSFKIDNKVSIGLGVNYSTIDLYSTRKLGTAAPFAGITAQNDLDGDGWGWNAGLLYKLSENDRIGLSYRSSMLYKLDGRAYAPGVMDSHAELKARMPWMATVSYYGSASSKVKLLADVSYIGWNVVGNPDVIANGAAIENLSLNLRNSYRVAVGGEYHYSNAITFKTGFSYDKTPVRGADTRLAAMPDSDRYTLGAGVRWNLSGKQNLDVGFGYAYIPSPSIDQNLTAVGRGSLNGKYDGSVSFFGIQYSNGF